MTDHQQTGASDNPAETSPADAPDEVLDLTAPPAPPVEHSPVGTAPGGALDPSSSPETSTPEGDEDAADGPGRHPSSPGFGTTEKFAGARLDLEAQRDRIRELEARKGGRK